MPWLSGSGSSEWPRRPRTAPRAARKDVQRRAALAPRLDEFVAPRQDALLFAGLKGQPVRRSNFGKAVDWTKTVADLGHPGLHFHDLRHTGNLLAAQTPGATLRDLMARMGHDSMRAALIYQHLTRDADRHIADAIAAQIARDTTGSGTEKEDDEGTNRGGG